MKKIRKNWIELILWLGVIIIIFLVINQCQFDYKNFRQNFLSNFTSTFLVAILFGFLFMRYFELSNESRPALMVNEVLGNVVIDKISSYGNIFNLTISVLNRGKKPIKEGYCHIFLDANFYLRSSKIKKTMVHEAKYTSIKIPISEPCYSNRPCDLIAITCKEAQKKVFYIYYMFSLENGVFPKGAEIDDLGKYNLNKLGKIKITIE